MDNYRFGSAYQELPEKKSPSNPERREILEAPRKWMRFFDTTMRSYLLDEPTPTRDEFLTQLNEYNRWNQWFLEPLMARAREIDDPNVKNDVANEFTFHQINGPLVYMWDQLLYDDVERYSEKSLLDIQTHLAVAMIPSIQRLIKLQNSDMTVHELKEYRMLKGTISESDSVITLLELVKKESRLVVVPAPELFESNPAAWNRNTDLLFIDTVNKKVHGIQVKTDTVNGTGRGRHYDSSYVSVVDSAHELGNTTFTNTNKQRRISLPGQVAMGLLSERPLKSAPMAVKTADFMRARQIAKEFSRGRRSFLTQATSNLADRIIPELEKDFIDEVTVIKAEAYRTQAKDDKSA